MDNQSKFGEIKKEFYTYRNGVVADNLRKLYPKGKIIYGLMAPQFSDISKKYTKDVEFGDLLWKDKNVRESRILALYILPPEKITANRAIEMIHDVESSEEAEFLAFKILRNLKNATEIYNIVKNDISDSPYFLHCVDMFKKNLDLI